MDMYKLAIIYGDNGYKSDDNFGKIDKFGDINDDLLHSACLLRFGKEKFPEVGVFNKLTFHHEPDVISYFFTKLGHAVFINSTSNGVKMGILLLPAQISDDFRNVLYKFAEEIEGYSVALAYDLEIVNGLLESKSIQDSIKKQGLKNLLDVYFLKNTKKLKK